LNRSIVWLIAILGFVAVGSWWGIRPRVAAPPKYQTAAVERGPIEASVSATGRIQPVEQVEIGSQVSGTVQKLFADYNASVTAGQVLCQLEPSSFRARVAQAEAAVALAEGAVTDGARSLRRVREQREQNAIPEVDLEAAEIALQQREADLQSAKAQLQVARVDLGHTTIRSPIDGVVIARTIDLGQTVAASPQSPRLFVIARSLANMRVETRIEEADIGLIRPGLPVTFTVDAYPDLTLHGQVEQVRLEPIVEQGVVTYTTVIATENPDLKLRPGMTANVAVLIARRENALKVPNAALRFRPPAEPVGRPKATAAPHGAAADSAGAAGAPASAMRPGEVYVLRRGKPTAIPVLRGITDGAMTEVVAAELGPDDRVIIGLQLEAKGPTRAPA
jgi:HlyD family secretion protein